jgi:hypothetical protein
MAWSCRAGRFGPSRVHDNCSARISSPGAMPCPPDAEWNASGRTFLAS